MHTVLCVGASADIADKDGETPLQAAQRSWIQSSDPEKKQRYEKVHEDTHTITHTLILPMVADRNILHLPYVLACHVVYVTLSSEKDYMFSLQVKSISFLANIIILLEEWA